MKLKSILILLILKSCLNLNLKNNIQAPSAGGVLEQGERLESTDNGYYLTMQADGNLVLYSTPAKNKMGKDNPIWQTGKNGQGQPPYRAIMQEDGNFVEYDAKNEALFSTGTHGKGSKPYQIKVQDDGNLVLYDKTDQPLWSSETNGKK